MVYFSTGGYEKHLNSLNKELEQYAKKNLIQTSALRPYLPDDFVEWNRIVYPPLHPATRLPTDIYDYQVEYFEAVRDFHKVVLNKSRKIGATETALRIILYNILQGNYSGQKVMIVAGNNQTIANKFISRMMKMLSKKFKDLNGKYWDYTNLLRKYNSRYMEFMDGTQVEAYPANEGVRGEENVICVFMSEVAFINRLDDTPIYNALKPNVINIPHADFILESTPNGKRGFFYRIYEEAERGENEFTPLNMPWQRSMNKLLNETIIANEKKNTSIDFDQEYCCKFTTSLSAAFVEEEVNKVFKPMAVTNWSDIIGDD